MKPGNFRIACLGLAAFIFLPSLQLQAQIFTTLSSMSAGGIDNPYGDLTFSGSNIYGYAGGLGSYGLIYRIPVSGGSLTDLVNFSGQPYGNGPVGSVTISGTAMYGATVSGGPAQYGTVYSAPLAGGNETNMFTFSGSNGDSPEGGLTLSGSTLYGSTYNGHALNLGTIYSIPVTGGSATTLLSFSGTGGAYPGNSPIGNLVLSGSTLYGVTAAGGTYNDGTVFSMPITGGTVTSLFSFSGSNGSSPQTLTLSGSTLYGTTYLGGAKSDGTVFSIPVTGGSLTTLLSFTGTNGTSLGANPLGALAISGSYLYGATNRGGGASNAGTVYRVPLTGGNATTLVAFNITNGSLPDGGVAFNGQGQTLYGTTDLGGSNSGGVIYSLNVAPAMIMFGGLANATIISGGSASFTSSLSNASSAGYSLNYALSSSLTSGTAYLSAIAPSGGSLSPGGSQSFTLSATSSTPGTNSFAITASDPNSSTGSLTESALLTVLGHSLPNLAVSNNNQSVIVGATGITAGLTLSNGTSNQTGLAALDVNSLSALVSGTTGSKLVASGTSQSYSASLSAGTLGTQAEVLSLNVGDDHTLSGASAPFNLSTTATWTVLGHAAPGLSIISGSSQTVIVGATGITAGLTLSNGTSNQAGLAALDVNSLGALVAGATGNKLIVSGSARSYTATLSAGTLGTQNDVFSLNVGDDHTLSGASAPVNLSTTATLTVLGHTAPSLSITSGNSQTVIVGATGVTAGLTLSNGPSSQTGLAALDVNSLGALVSGTTGGKLVTSGSSQSYSASLSAGTLGTQHEAFSLNVGDDHTLAGASAPVNLSTTATVTVLGHAAPSLFLSSGNNQTVIIGATGIAAGLVLSNGTANQSGLAALDVNSLGTLVSGTTGAKLVASGLPQSYTASLSTGTLGTQTQVFSLNAGDDHTLLGASAATNLSASATLTVLGHAAPSLAVATGNNQIVVVGASGVTAGLSLSNGTLNQAGLASLDVNSLGSGLSGATGGKLLASGSTTSYTAALNTATLGPQSQQPSLNVGDDHALPGAAAAGIVSGNVSLTVLDHSNASLSSSATQTAATISFGNLLKGATAPASQSFTIYNRAANTAAFYTSNLKLTSFSSSGDTALSTTLSSFGGLAASALSQLGLGIVLGTYLWDSA